MKDIEVKLSNIFEWFTEICFVLMFLSTVWQIISRSVLGIACTWTDEFSRFMYEWITFIGAIITTLHREHIRVEVLHDRMPPKVQMWLDIITNMIAVVFCIIAAYGGSILIKLNINAYFSALPRFLTYSLLYMPITISMVGVGSILIIRIICGIRKALSCEDSFAKDESGGKANG